MALGLLMMTYGSPSTKEEIKDYYTRIRRGQEPSTQELIHIEERYQMIGQSPLVTITREQAYSLAQKLSTIWKEEVVPYIGCLYSHPFIDETIKQMQVDGIDKVYALPATPFSTPATIGTYQHVLKQAMKGTSLEVKFITGWYQSSSLINYWKRALHKAVTDTFSNNIMMAGPIHEDKQILNLEGEFVFSAHSLPQVVIDRGDDYVNQVNTLINGIVDACNLDSSHVHRAWQSAGKYGQWLEPDLSSTIAQLGEKKARIVIVLPIGFIADHLEILYDDDILCKSQCRELGIVYIRPNMPNSHRLCIDAMAEAVLDKGRF